MKNQSTTALFKPLTINGLEFNNRIAMAPMTRSRAIGSVPNDLMVAYYAQRASAGLLITEGTSPSPNGLGYARIPGIFNDVQVKGWKKVTDAIHKKRGKIFLQLMHSGRIGHSENLPENAEILAPSAIAAEGQMWTDSLGMQALPLPREMTLPEIESTIQEYVKAAENAIEAGFDGVEIHAANGYLPGQFLNPHSNQRTDRYGNSLENRSRFTLELSASISKAIGKEKVGVRISPYGTFNSMGAYDETFTTYDYLSKELSKQGISYIHLVEPAAAAHTEGLQLIEKIRNNFKNTLILNGGYTGENAAEALEAGRADLISFGVPFISNPDFTERVKNGIPLSSADSKTFYSASAEGYTDYPFYTASQNSITEIQE